VRRGEDDCTERFVCVCGSAGPWERGLLFLLLFVALRMLQMAIEREEVESGCDEARVSPHFIYAIGVQLVATAHGNELENLVKNPSMADLVGGIQVRPKFRLIKREIYSNE